MVDRKWMVGDSDGNDSEAGLAGEMHIRKLQKQKWT